MTETHTPCATICLPTFNEAANLPLIAAEIFAYVPQARLLVIDDNSPDGTGEVAKRLAAADDRIRILHRPQKEGLGRAYLDAFARLANAADTGPFVVQMDADLSHPPARLPALLAAAVDADLVIGSRYVAEGGVSDWSWRRRLLSRFGSAYARFWLGLKIRDLTGGFKVWRRELLARVIERPIAAGGYAFQVETTYLAHLLGARIVETPILFAERARGESKMSADIALEAFTLLPRLAWQHRRDVLAAPQTPPRTS